MEYRDTTCQITYELLHLTRVAKETDCHQHPGNNLPDLQQRNEAGHSNLRTRYICRGR